MSSQRAEEPEFVKRLSEISTHWSLIEQARQGKPEEVERAIQQLVLRYSAPLRRYLVGAPFRLDTHGAEDMVQGFVESKLLGGNLLQRFDPEAGRFRAYLKQSLNNYVYDSIRSRAKTPLAQARGGFDDPAVEKVREVIEPRGSLDPFDAAWARELIQSTTQEFEQYCHHQKLSLVWDIFCARVLEPLTSGRAPRSYEQLAAEAGLLKAKDAANKLTTATRIFRKLFEERVRAYAASDEDYASELRHLRSVFAAGLSLAESEEESAVRPPNDGSLLMARVFELPQSGTAWTPFELEVALEGQLSMPLEAFVTPDSEAANENAKGRPTLLAAITSQQTAISDLQAVKSWAKREAIDREQALPPEVTSTIYFAALASARVFHQTRLTRLSDRSLDASLRKCEPYPWIHRELRQLFRSCLVCLQGGEQ